MKTYKGGNKISLLTFLSGKNNVFYITQLDKVMHYEVIISLPFRIVLNWIDTGILLEAIKMTPKEAKEAYKLREELLAKRYTYNGIITNIKAKRKGGNGLYNRHSKVDFEDDLVKLERGAVLDCDFNKDHKQIAKYITTDGISKLNTMIDCCKKEGIAVTIERIDGITK